jgi:hypothetical protein
MTEAPRLSWHAAFVVTTFALGGTVDDGQASLERSDLPLAANVAAGLAHPDRTRRARALAMGVAQIAADVEQARLQ